MRLGTRSVNHYVARIGYFCLTITLEIIWASRHFLCWRRIVDCVHLRQMTTGLIHCIAHPPPPSKLLDPPLLVGHIIYMVVQKSNRINSNDVVLKLAFVEVSIELEQLRLNLRRLQRYICGQFQCFECCTWIVVWCLSFHQIFELKAVFSVICGTTVAAFCLQ